MRRPPNCTLGQKRDARRQGGNYWAIEDGVIGGDGLAVGEGGHSIVIKIEGEVPSAEEDSGWFECSKQRAQRGECVAAVKMRRKQRPRAGIFIGEGDSAKAIAVDQVKGRAQCRTCVISIETQAILPKLDRISCIASKLKEPTAAQHIVKIDQMESSNAREGGLARAQDECGAGGKC